MHTKIFPRYESFENWTNSFLLVPNFVCTLLRNFNANFFYSLRPNLDATHFLILNDSVCKALKHERKGVSRRRVYRNLSPKSSALAFWGDTLTLFRGGGNLPDSGSNKGEKNNTI